MSITQAAHDVGPNRYQSEMPRRVAKTYREFDAQYSAKRRIRSAIRNLAIHGLSIFRSVSRTSGWIRFPYYHHVFDDERRGFERQLSFMKEHGTFIPFDEAIALLRSAAPIAGRYFCLSFDDGLKNCVTNALPILVSSQAPCMFFIATGYVGLCLENFPNPFGYSAAVEFLTWDDCRTMISLGMQIGSHTHSHRSLKALSAGEAAQEMQSSKRQIESELQCSCDHFCAPRGIPDVDFIKDRDPNIAKRLGYDSFATTKRGAMRQSMSPHLLLRDHLIARWGNHQLRYFFSC